MKVSGIKAKYFLLNFFCMILKLFHMRSFLSTNQKLVRVNQLELTHLVRGLVVGNLLSLMAGWRLEKSTGWLWSPTMIMSQEGPGCLPNSAEVHYKVLCCVESTL